MAQTSKDQLSNSEKDFTCLQDVLCAFNNSINEEQAWAVCFQCAQFLKQNSSQGKYRDIYYYGTVAIKLGKDGEVRIDMTTNQGSGKGPPRRRSSFSRSKEFKTTVTQVDAVQALGSAIYKALDYGLSEVEEPHLGGDLEDLIEFMTHPTDDDEGIDVERDSDDSQGRDPCMFQEIIDKCVRHLSSNQNAGLHYKAVCRALVTESRELKTFLDKISSEQEFLARSSGVCENPDGLDNLQRADWARLWVQIMGELRHGVRLKKVEHVQISPMEYELTPFEILLEDIRLGRFKLNRIMVNGDIPQIVRQDAHAVILDFIRSRPPLKSVKKRVLSSPPKREMDPRELLMHDICQHAMKLKPVRQGRLVVGAKKPCLDGDDQSMDEDSPKPVRKVIKPVAAFEVSTDDSDDSYVSDTLDDEGRYHVKAPVMSPMSPVTPDDGTWIRTVTKDLAQQPGCQSLARRHSISVCNRQMAKKVPVSHAEPLMEESVATHNNSFVRGHATRKPTRTKLVSYRQSHDQLHDNINITSASVKSRHRHSLHGNETTMYRAQSPVKHAGQGVLSRTQSEVDVGVVTCNRTCMHDVSRKLHCVSSELQPTRSRSPCGHAPRSLSPCLHAARAESPVRFLSRSQTFTTNTSRSSQNVVRDKPIVIARCDSPQTRQMVRSDSFPPSDSDTPQQPFRAESPRRHSVHSMLHGHSRASDSQHDRCGSPRCRKAWSDRSDSPSRHSGNRSPSRQSGNRSRSQSPCRPVSQSDLSKRVTANKPLSDPTKCHKTKVTVEHDDQSKPALQSSLCKSVPDVRKFRSLCLQESKSSPSPQELEMESQIRSQEVTPKVDDVPSQRPRPALVLASDAVPSQRPRPALVRASDDVPSQRPRPALVRASDDVPSQRLRPALVRARSRPEIRPTSLVLKSQNEREPDNLGSGSPSPTVPSGVKSRIPTRSRIPRTVSTRNRSDRVSGTITEHSSGLSVDKHVPNLQDRPVSVDNSAKTVKFRSQSETLWLSIEKRVPNVPANSKATDASAVDKLSNSNDESRNSKSKQVRLSRQSAMRPARSNTQSRQTRSESLDEDNQTSVRTRRSGVVTQSDLGIHRPAAGGNNEMKSQQQYKEVAPEEEVTRRIQQITKDKIDTESSNKVHKEVTFKTEVSPQRIMVSPQNDVVSPQKVSQQVNISPDKLEASTTRHMFKEARPVLRSRSDVRRKETGPIKGSHVLDTDSKETRKSFPITNSSPTVSQTKSLKPASDICNSSLSPQSGTENSKVAEITGAIKAGVTNVTDLLHVSWKSECRRDSTNTCSDCRPIPHKWQNPIQCLSLTLEEVTHIRMVLTKAEHESLITDTELYNAISKAKVCFTCKKTKFSLFGQWGTKCKFCQRTVCNYCLRKMNVPTEHFEKIPVYSLSPVPISPEILEALKVYESTGSVPQSPATARKDKPEEPPTDPPPPRNPTQPGTASPDGAKLAVKRSTLQRSHTIGVGVTSRPLPNKALLKGPQMSICCDCKMMIMEIIRASRTTVSLVNKPREITTKEAPVVSLRPRVTDDRSRPRSMMNSPAFKSFNFSKTESDL